ncbi:MAG TPA: hypothetical protein PLT92_13785 [Ignavibacteriaceae bacterium]|nr:hypothetical protein [Ignavibacteriaceae bacterium]
MKRILYGTILLVLFSLLGCQENYESSKKIKVLQEKVDSLRSKMDSIKFALQYHILYSDYEKNEYVYLDLTSEGGYVSVKIDLGFTLLVAVDNVEPFLDGYKIRLRIGNPYSLHFLGGKMNVFWGKSFINMKVVDFTSSLIPAYWNVVTINLTPFKKEEGTTIKINFQFDKISLHKKQSNTN